MNGFSSAPVGLETQRDLGRVRAEHAHEVGVALEFFDQSQEREPTLLVMRRPVRDSQVILRALRHRPDGMTRTEIRDLFGRNRKGSDYGRALQALAERGLVRSETQTTGGRDAERWFATTKTTKGSR